MHKHLPPCSFLTWRRACLSFASHLAELAEKLPPIDHLVLCASSSVAFGSFAEVSEQALRAAIDNKLIGYWLATQALLPRLTLDSSVIMVTGAAHRTAMPGMAAVAAVNGGIAAFAQVLAVELAPIRVNVVSPGMVATHVYDGMPAERREAMFKQAGDSLPAGRIGRPDDIAEVVMATLRAGYMTGAVLDVDGGAHLARP